MVDAGPDPSYEEKKSYPPPPPPHPKPPGTRQKLFCDKNTLLQRGSVYTKKLKRLIGQAGWLTDWLTDWENKQTDSYILLHTALKHWSAVWREGGGSGTLILSYISRFCPFLEIQKFELHFLLGGGGGGRGRRSEN